VAPISAARRLGRLGAPASRIFEPPAEGSITGIFPPDREGAADRQNQNAGGKHKDGAGQLMVEQRAEKWQVEPSVTIRR